MLGASISMCVIVLIASPLEAAWIADGVPVCLADSVQANARIIADGTGGAIIVWPDHRAGNDDVYAQRLDADGNRLWGTYGTLVYAEGNDQKNVALVSDGAGGAIITWEDYHAPPSSDVFAQRMYANGTRAWVRPTGICSAPGSQLGLRIIPDGSGGAIIAWSDLRSGSGDIYAQRISAAGSVLWTLNGVGVCTADQNQLDVDIVSSGSSGVILAWRDDRSVTKCEIYAQRLNLAGIPAWAADGLPVCTSAGYKDGLRAVSDGSGGAIAAWADFRNGSTSDIFAQRISPSGDVLWASAGVPVCTGLNDQNWLDIDMDGSGGAVLCWMDFRADVPPGSNIDLYAQRIDPSGTVLWAEGGLVVCANSNKQYWPCLTGDGAGGAIIAWHETVGMFQDNVLAQLVGAQGALLRPGEALSISSAPEIQGWPHIAGDGHGAAFVTWDDTRNGGHDIYAQYAGFAMTQVPGGEVPRTRLVVDCYPNPFNPLTTLRFDLPVGGRVRLAVYDVAGRLLRTLLDVDLPAGSHTAVWDGRDSVGRSLASGSYFARLQAGGRLQTVRMSLVR